MMEAARKTERCEKERGKTTVAAAETKANPDKLNASATATRKKLNDAKKKAEEKAASVTEPNANADGDTKSCADKLNAIAETTRKKLNPSCCIAFVTHLCKCICGTAIHCRTKSYLSKRNKAEEAAEGSNGVQCTLRFVDILGGGLVRTICSYVGHDMWLPMRWTTRWVSNQMTPKDLQQALADMLARMRLKLASIILPSQEEFAKVTEALEIVSEEQRQLGSSKVVEHEFEKLLDIVASWFGMTTTSSRESEEVDKASVSRQLLRTTDVVRWVSAADACPKQYVLLLTIIAKWPHSRRDRKLLAGALDQHIVLQRKVALLLAASNLKDKLFAHICDLKALIQANAWESASVQWEHIKALFSTLCSNVVQLHADGLESNPLDHLRAIVIPEALPHEGLECHLCNIADKVEVAWESLTELYEAAAVAQPRIWRSQFLAWTDLTDED